MYPLQEKKSFGKKQSLVACFVILLASPLFSTSLKAAFDVPIHSVHPDLAGLNVRYYVRATPIRITLNVINHDSKDVICDAQYRSGPQTYNTKEITIATGEADSFVFRYGRKTEKVKLMLKCIAAKTLKDELVEADINTPELTTEQKTENIETSPQGPLTDESETH